jgi:hypothetical protein
VFIQILTDLMIVYLFDGHSELQKNTGYHIVVCKGLIEKLILRLCLPVFLKGEKKMLAFPCMNEELIKTPKSLLP